jgi:SAM-dependent methyltransferase
VGLGVSDQMQDIVSSGYDAVYEAMPRSPTLRRIWREYAMGADFPEGFEHISFLTLDEMRRMAGALRLGKGGHLVDLACGAGGPGLWVAREAGAHLTGIDISAVAVAKATERATSVRMTDRAQFKTGSFAETGLPDASADAAMSVDALQYAPDKAAAFREFARIIHPGGRLAFAAFALDPQRSAALPVLNLDPVDDYRPLLARAGFHIDVYEETDAWFDRLTASYGAIVAARDALMTEMGERAANALLFETSLTLEHRPYSSRVFVSATRRAAGESTGGSAL